MNTFFFDLDGTLLPFDQDAFTEEYFSRLVRAVPNCPVPADKLKKAIWYGTGAMIQNDGKVTNEELFWRVMADILTPDFRQFEPDFLRFYETDFQNIQGITTLRPEAAECIRLLKEKGYALYLTTNPIFPAIATHSRIRWAGLNPEDFQFITTYETSSYCKPNLNYYREVLDRFDLNPSDCMMVGNDTAEDMCTASLGMSTYLITDCLIHRDPTPPAFPLQGSLQDFLAYVTSLPNGSTHKTA